MNMLKQCLALCQCGVSSIVCDKPVLVLATFYAIYINFCSAQRVKVQTKQSENKIIGA